MHQAFKIAILSATCLCSCKQQVPQQSSFAENPICPSCVVRACSGHDDSFEAHVKSTELANQAQILARMEAESGCMDKFDWILPIADRVYAAYGPSFYAPDQPWLEARGKRAFQDLQNQSLNHHEALAYLSKHLNEWQNLSWAKANIASLQDRIASSDDIFALVAQVADDEQLAKMAELESTEQRDAALIYRWKNLPEEARNRAIGAYIQADWSLQTSGSAILPQYLTLDWKKKPLPAGVPDFVATIDVDTLKAGKSQIKRGKWLKEDTFVWPPLQQPNGHHDRLNLQPWFSSANTYRVNAAATIKIWPDDVPESCLKSTEAASCGQEPITTLPVVLDRSYRVFAGVETGAPHRHKVDADNQKTSEVLKLSVCNESECTEIWNGAKVKLPQTPIKIRQGHDFYLKYESPGAVQPVAGRLMARQGEGKAWREVAAFFGYEPQDYEVPGRAEIALGTLCGKLGECKLDLQLRPSLRMARRDPRIARYWGATIELGRMTLDIQNLTAQQLWEGIE